MKQKGFTIIELMVCILIITIGLIGVLSLVVLNIQAQSINKNALIASQLAQEGVELVRNARDNNWLRNIYWKTNVVNDGTYTIDYLATINQDVNSISESDAKLYLDEDGYYTHTVTASTTVFSRLISVADKTNYLDITSAVRWKERNNYYNYVAEVYLYDWN
ncbi:MAG: prepilin-type N-terminal cleavage/methylation domain-containing protein [Patescibacteria group bacterium]